MTGCRMRTFDTPASIEEEKSAAGAAEKLRIPLITEDFREEFRQEVIRVFAAEYGAGRTPNPCCVCNRQVKWKALMRCMERTGASYVATGHYAAVEKNGARFCIRSTDSRKDQSYALYNLTQEEIACTLFPLAGMDKSEVRGIAAEAGLLNAEKPDSMEICFIPDNDYAAFLKENFGLTDRPGNYVDMDGNVLGTHPGIVHLTVGQRKGLGIALGKKVFVREIRPLSNEVVLAEDSAVFSRSLRMTDVNFQLASEDMFRSGESCEDGLQAARVRIRYADPGTPGRLYPDGESDGRQIWRIDFAGPVRAVTPGQAAVLYDGNGCILCGGTILPPGIR